MFRVIIIDDVPSAVSALELLLKRKFSDVVEIVATSTSAAAAKKLIQEQSPDLVFLDIEMPGLSGMDLLRSFPDPAFHVVFVTAYDTYAVDAFRLGAADYLLKPVEAVDIARVIRKLTKNREQGHTQLENRFRHLEEILTHTSPDPKIGISMSEKIVFVQVMDILYCEARGPYTHIFFRDGNRIISSRPLREYELMLTVHQFFRIHNSYVINLNRVKEFKRHDGGYVVMENGERLEVSQRKRKDFLQVVHDTFI